MSILICFILCAVRSTVSATTILDNGTLESVFGSPQAPFSQQVIPLRPNNSTYDFIDIDANPEDYYQAPVKNYDAFDWYLTKRVSMNTQDNFLLSPLGLKLGLAILTEAATGRTKDELASVLGFDKDVEVVRRKFANIVKSLQLSPTSIQHEKPAPSIRERLNQKLREGWKNFTKWFSQVPRSDERKCIKNIVEANSSQYILNLGSRVYVDGSTETQQRFAAIAEENYKTDVRPVDFSDANAAAAAINDWVCKLTKGNIETLVKPEDIENQIMMVINALYFKGTWVHQFDVNDTKTDTFYVAPKVKRETQFMNIQHKFHFVESKFLDSKILRMPFLGKKFSMYIVVPNTLLGLPLVMENLGNLRREMFHLDPHIVDLRIPKFVFDSSSQLDGVIRELGVKEAFTDNASFPGITRGHPSKKVKISRVLQKAGIEVNEVGSTAYAVTEISLVNKFGVDANTVQEVIANKPFLFFIEDEQTRQLLFTGRLVDPTQRLSVFKYDGE